MTSRAKLCFPAATGKVQSATKDLMDVTHREGDVVDPALSRGQLQEEQVMVAALVLLAVVLLAFLTRRPVRPILEESRG